MDEPKNCAFQFAITRKFIGTKIYEDTDLITLTEAKKLYEKYLPSFIKNLQEENNPEMVIWIDMPDNSSYGKSLVYLDSNYETDGHKVWKQNITKEYVEI